MRRQLRCVGLFIAALAAAGCAGGEGGPNVSSAEQKALPADAELIVASAVCPKSMVTSEQDRRVRRESKIALETLEQAVRTHPDYTVTVERHSSDEAPYVWHDEISVLDLAKEMQEEAVYSATTPGSGTASPWAQCRHRLADRLDALVEEAE